MDALLKIQCLGKACRLAFIWE